MVMQATVVLLVGGSNPGGANTAAALPATVDRPGFEPPTKKFGGRVCYHLTGGECDRNLSPIAWSLLSENF